MKYIFQIQEEDVLDHMREERKGVTKQNKRQNYKLRIKTSHNTFIYKPPVLESMSPPNGSPKPYCPTVAIICTFQINELNLPSLICAKGKTGQSPITPAIHAAKCTVNHLTVSTPFNSVIKSKVYYTCKHFN